METIRQRYRRRADAFAAKVEAVRSDQWSAPSPCAKWSAADVVTHVIDMHRAMLTPLGRTFDADPRADAVAAFRTARASIEAVLDDPAAAATPCDTPLGRVSVAEHIDGVVSDDLVVHGWDLARATGQDDRLDETDVVRLWEHSTAVPPELMTRLRTPGAFGPGIEVYGPEVPVRADVRTQDRLLGFLGRDPSWSAR